VASRRGEYQFGGCRDDARYFLLARSLARGEDYGVHVGPLPVASPYPFVLPLLLAPFAAWAPDQPGAGASLDLAFTLLNAALLFWGWRRLSGLRSRWWGLAASLLYLVSPLAVALAQMLNADAVFTAIALLALMLTESCARAERRSPPALLALGFLLAGALFTRTAGVALVAAVLVRLAWPWRGGWARGVGALVAGASLLLLPALAFTSLRARDLQPQTYSRAFLDPAARGHDPADGPLAARAVRGAAYYAGSGLREAVFPFGGGEREAAFGGRFGMPWLPRATSLAVAALVALGAAWSARGALTASVLLFEAFHLGLHLLWHHRAARFLYPILPLLSLQLVWGVRLVARAASARAGARAGAAAGGWRRARLAPRAAAVLTVAVLVAAGVHDSARGTYLQTRRVVRDFSAGTLWLRRNAAPGEVVLAEQPATVHLYADRPVVPLETCETAADVLAAIRRFEVRWVLVAPELAWDDAGRRHYGPRTAEVVLPLLESLRAAGRAELAYESEAAELVRVYRLTTATPPESAPATAPGSAG